MVLPLIIEDDKTIEQIEDEIRMARYRQNAQRLTWEGFTHAFRRNLREKRNLVDAESKIDIQNTLSFMRKHMPIDSSSSLDSQLVTLSNSLECAYLLQPEHKLVVMKNQELLIEMSCDFQDGKPFKLHSKSPKIAYYGRVMSPTLEAQVLISKHNFTKLRTLVFNSLAVVPNLPHNEKQQCLQTLDIMEQYLGIVCGKPSFDQIDNSPVGYYLPRGPLHPGRLYYVVDPIYRAKAGRTTMNPDFDFHHLPHLELLVVKHNKELPMPFGPPQNPYSSTKAMSSCFCLRFSAPFALCYVTWRKMAQYCARPSVIRQHVNIYRYMVENSPYNRSDVVLRTCFPEGHQQHKYIFPGAVFRDESDVVIGEIYVKSMEDLDKIVALIRVQHMHNLLYISFLAACCQKWRGGDVVTFRVIPNVNCFDLSFVPNAEKGVMLARFAIDSQLKWNATVVDSNNEHLDKEIDRQMTVVLNKKCSIPVALTRLFILCKNYKAEPDPLPKPSTDTGPPSHFYDKIGRTWFNVRSKKKRTIAHSDNKNSIEDDDQLTQLLASIKFVEGEPQSPLKAEAHARTSRLQSDSSYAHAFTDLEAICQMADTWDGDSKSPGGVATTARHESSPAATVAAQRNVGSTSSSSGGGGVGGGLPQLSPLDSARLRMAHCVSAAASGSTVSTPDVFDFPDDRSVSSSGSNFPSPSPHGAPFGFPVTSPLGATGIRGGVTKRRPRARKTANMGDRTPSTDSQISPMDMFGMNQKKPRGQKGVRRPRGSRKPTGFSMDHTHLDMSRPPMLQRSFSDMPGISPFPITPTGLPMESPYREEYSEEDDVCDPPMPRPFASQTPTYPGPMMGMPPMMPAPNNTMPSPLMATGSPQVSSPSVSQPVPSPLSLPTTSASSPASGGLRVQPQRKTSFDIPPVPLKKPVAPTPPPVRKNILSDLYDDGADSPPPPEERIPGVVGVSQTAASTSVPAVSSPAQQNSPKPPPEGETTPTPAKPLILKIKTPSRASPTVDAQRAKSAVPKPEKERKKKEKEYKEKDRDREKKEKADRKRKADGAVEKKDKEHKKHKTTNLPPELCKPNVGAPLFPSLKNFRIPKKEGEAKEPPTPTTPVPPTLMSPSTTAPPFPPPMATPTVPPHQPPHQQPPPNMPLAPPSGPKGILKKNSGAGIAPQLMPPTGPPIRQPPPYNMPPNRRQPLIQQGPPPVMERRPPGMPPSLHMPGSISNIPLPRNAPPRQAPGVWVKPPSLQQQPVTIPLNRRSASPTDVMQIDDDAGSPEDSLRIADD